MIETPQSSEEGQPSTESKVQPSTDACKDASGSPPDLFPEKSHDKKQLSFKELGRRLYWRLHWLAPNTIPAALEEDRSFYRKRESESNLDTRVPPTERIQTAALWGAEFFGPSEVDLFYEALKVLGWSQRHVQNEPTVDWVKRERTYGQGGSWYNVGVVLRPGDRRFFGGHNRAPLPDGVDHAFIEINQVSPSLTCVVACFILKDDSSSMYERELNQDRRILRRRVPGSWAVCVLDPVHLKQASVDRVRGEQQTLVAGWFQENLPGFFASRKDASRFPTGELLTTQDVFLFSEPDPTLWPRRGGFNWQKIVDNTSAFDIWTCEKMPALQVSLGSRNRDGSNHLVCAIHLPTITEDHWRYRGPVPRNIGQVSSLCKDYLDGPILYIGVVDYLRELDSDLKRTRESMSLSNLRKQGPLNLVRRIQMFFDTSIGLPSIARELEHQSQQEDGLHGIDSAFSAPAWREGADKRELHAVLRAGIQHHSLRLRENEAAIREQLEQLSTVISVRESVRAQRRMEVLTVIALLVAAASLLAAFPQSWADILKATVAGIFSDPGR